MKSLHVRKASSLLFCFSILLTACTSFRTDEPSSESNVSQTHKGVTVTITDITHSLTNTVVTFVVQADPQWNLSVESDPPARAMEYNSTLTDDTGTQYTPRSSEYGIAQLDASTGGVKFENKLTFEPILSDTLTLQTEIEIEGIPASPAIEISLNSHQVNEIWSIDQGIAFSNFVDLPVNVELLSLTDRDVVLEFVTEHITSDGLELGCLHFWPDTDSTANFFADCSSDETQIASRTGMDLPSDGSMQVLLHITGSAIITEPFTVSWPATNK